MQTQEGQAKRTGLHNVVWGIHDVRALKRSRRAAPNAPGADMTRLPSPAVPAPPQPDGAGGPREQALRAALSHVLDSVPNADARGKVRAIFTRSAAHPDELLLVATDRVSAFDHVLGTIPAKGALLTAQAAHWLTRAADVIDTHFIEQLGPQTMRCAKASPVSVEVVVRGHLAGSLMREPKATRGHAYGLRVAPDMPDYAAFDAPVITPTTKAPAGAHDAPITPAQLIAEGRASKAEWATICAAAIALFQDAAAQAKQAGLTLADTKYEFGRKGGRIVLIDEVHTADSSRYWDDTMQGPGGAPYMLDKERLRTWLRAQGFTGHGTPPVLTDTIRVELAAHYWALTERLLGRAVDLDVNADAQGVAQTVAAWQRGM